MHVLKAAASHVAASVRLTVATTATTIAVLLTLQVLCLLFARSLRVLLFFEHDFHCIPQISDHLKDHVGHERRTHAQQQREPKAHMTQQIEVYPIDGLIIGEQSERICHDERIDHQTKQEIGEQTQAEADQYH